MFTIMLELHAQCIMKMILQQSQSECRSSHQCIGQNDASDTGNYNYPDDFRCKSDDEIDEDDNESVCSDIQEVRLVVSSLKKFKIVPHTMYTIDT